MSFNGIRFKTFILEFYSFLVKKYENYLLLDLSNKAVFWILFEC